MGENPNIYTSIHFEVRTVWKGARMLKLKYHNAPAIDVDARTMGWRQVTERSTHAGPGVYIQPCFGSLRGAIPASWHHGGGGADQGGP